MHDVKNNTQHTSAAMMATAAEQNVQKYSCLLLTPVPALAALFLNGAESWWLLGLFSLAITAMALVADKIPSLSRDYMLSFAFVAHSILFTASLSGHAWQLDTHMLFFVVLAIVSTLGNPKALVLATVLIALHHASFSFLMPNLVYPGGDLITNLERTALHAAILLMEAAALLLLTLSKNKAAANEVVRQQQVLRAQAQAAEEAKAEAEKSRKSAEHVTTVLGRHLGEMANGHLDCKIREEFPEEYKRLRSDFNDTVTTLQETIQQVLETTGSINNGANEIRRASDQLSSRTESQAATLEQTAASLEELTTSVKSAADGARSVENTMGEARHEAETSGEIVKSAVAAMTTIEQSSSQISRIISVIDDIAFQTNLLALNAGVEAARAGEAGQGFAVVASEVRALAQRSADAATEIKTLIAESSRQVDHGVDLVGKAGTAIESIVERVNQISTLISDIAEGAAEQATGLGEINTGVTQLDQVTQQNAAMVEEATAAGHLLHADTDKLSALMARFDIAAGNGQQMQSSPSLAA